MELLITIFKYLTHHGVKEKAALISVVLETKLGPMDTSYRKHIMSDWVVSWT